MCPTQSARHTVNRWTKYQNHSTHTQTANPVRSRWRAAKNHFWIVVFISIISSLNYINSNCEQEGEPQNSSGGGGSGNSSTTQPHISSLQFRCIAAAAAAAVDWESRESWKQNTIGFYYILYVFQSIIFALILTRSLALLLTLSFSFAVAIEPNGKQWHYHSVMFTTTFGIEHASSPFNWLAIGKSKSESGPKYHIVSSALTIHNSHLQHRILYELIIALFICPIRIKVEIYCIYLFRLLLRAHATKSLSHHIHAISTKQSNARKTKKNGNNVCVICMHCRVRACGCGGDDEWGGTKIGVYLRVKQLLPLHKIMLKKRIKWKTHSTWNTVSSVHPSDARQKPIDIPPNRLFAQTLCDDFVRHA